MLYLSKIFEKGKYLGLIVLVGLSCLTPTVRAADATPIYAPKLNDISCTSGDFCVAVGEYARVSVGTNVLRPLISMKQGGTWSNTTDLVPADPNYLQASLKSVNCLGSEFCIAMGIYTAGTLPTRTFGWSATFDGTKWMPLNDSLGPATTVGKVSCSSINFCMSSLSDYSGDYGHTTALIFRGTFWEKHRSEFQIESLWSLGQPVCFIDMSACRIATSEASSTSRSDLSNQHPAIISYMANFWLVDRMTFTNLGPAENLSCPNISACLVSGPNMGIWEYDGSNKQQLTPEQLTIPTSSNLVSKQLACWNVRQCLVVGTLQDESNLTEKPYVLQQANSSWSSYNFPFPVGVTKTHFDSLSCVAYQSSCAALGTYIKNGDTKTFVALFDGVSWQTTELFSEVEQPSGLVVKTERTLIKTKTNIQVTLKAGSQPISSTRISMVVTKGPCRGSRVKATTNTQGRATLTYKCARVGTDEFQVSAASAGQSYSTKAQIEWYANQPLYVAFGDSLTTGGSIEGCRPNRELSPWGCTHANARSYPNRVAQALGYTRTSFERVGIWGDTVEAATKARIDGKNAQGPWKPQLTAVEGAQKVVTGALGVNDLHFSDLKRWIKLYLSSATGDKVTPAVQQIIQNHSADFEQMFNTLLVAKNNGATVVVTLYYNPYDNSKVLCGPLKSIGDRLVNTLDQELANRSVAHQFKVADFRTSFREHGSGSKNSYVFGDKCEVSSGIVNALSDWLDNDTSHSKLVNHFDPHPNNKGTKAMADSILGVLR